MIGCLMQVACKLVMENHFYSYDNKIRKQKRHDRKYIEKLAALGLENEDFSRYVDDETAENHCK